MNDILPKPFTKQGLLDMLEVRFFFFVETRIPISLTVAQKHLMHLKVIQQMSKFPRGIDDGSLADPLASPTGTTAGTGSSVQLVSLNGPTMVPTTSVDDDGRINPLAGLGLTDEQYATILQNMVSGEAFPGLSRMGMGGVVGGSVGGDPVSGPSVGEKRRLEDADDPTDVKRSRFELVE